MQRQTDADSTHRDSPTPPPSATTRHNGIKLTFEWFSTKEIINSEEEEEEAEKNV